MDDLTAPLRARKGGIVGEMLARILSAFPGKVAIRPLPALLILIAAAVVTAALYARLAGDPLGGNPATMISLNTPPPQPSPDPDIGGTAMRGPQPIADEDGFQSVEMPMHRPAEGSNDVVDTGDGGAKVIIIRPEEGVRETPLPSVPDSRLVERTPAGLLPKRAEDGTAPADIYARPHRFDAAGNSARSPKIALLVNGMGLNRQRTQEAIATLPPGVTFAFAPYADNLQEWVTTARRDGHEVLLQIPMEPFDYPDNDPGPHTLLSSLTPKDNLARLHWSMARMVGYAGVTNYMGARFTASREVLRPALLEFKKRGLLFIDDGTSPRSLAQEIADDIGLPTRRANVVLDAVPAPDAITAAIERLEVAAYQDGVAVGVISALPVSIETVSNWLENLSSRGIEIIPVSASTKAVAEG